MFSMYRSLLTQFIRGLVVASCLSVTTVAVAAGEAGVDAVLIMDSSGSMAKNDPDKLRVPAAKMFMSLLRENDRVGLISFSDDGYPVLRPTAPLPKKMKRILSSADKVSSKGVYTNIHAALSKGIRMLDRYGKEGQEKILILMSDGKMDVGNSAEDRRLTEEVRTRITQALKDKAIKVYTIAFTESSDVDLLRYLSDETGALFRLARNDEDLHKVFSAIFESAKDPDMLPIDGGEFTVDDSIDEVTIVASKEGPRVQVYLQPPEGRKLSAKDAGSTLKWFQSHHFDMITIKKPQPGLWKLLSTSGKNRAYIVTNMALRHNPQQLRLATNHDMVIEAWLEEDGQLLNREAVLTNTEFYLEIEAPDGAVAEFNLFDNGEYGDRVAADGRYSNTFAYEKPGAYRISLRAVGETFKREKTVYFDIEAPETTALETPAPEETVVKAPPVQPEPEPAPKATPELATETNPAPPAKDAETPGPETPPQTEEEPAASTGPGIGTVIGVFVGINLLLGLIGGGVWWFLKRRKASGDDAQHLPDEQTD